MQNGSTFSRVKASAKAALCNALQYTPGMEQAMRAGYAPDDVADRLLQCLKGEVLDFQQLDTEHASLVAQLPPDAWSALQAHSAAGGHAGISTLILPAPDSGNAMPRRFAVRGWSSLPMLEHLQLARTLPGVPESSKPDLKAPAAASPAASAKAAEPGRGAPTPPASSWSAPFRASDLHSLPPHARMVESRHMALQWMNGRVNQRRATQQAPHGPKTGSGSATAGPRTAIDFKSLTWGGPQALFEISQFGNMIAHEMGGMEVGEIRHFALLSPSHTYALELETRVRATGAREFIVNFYCPDGMATHERVVVDAAARLRHRPLNAWITESALRASFGIGDPRIGCLYRWHRQPPDARQGAGHGAPDIHVADEHRSSPAFLYWALMAGHADSVTASVGRTLALATALEPADLYQRLAARPMQVAGLFSAMGEGRVNAVTRYADAILKAPADIVDSALRHVLLKADRRGLHAVGHAMMEGQAATVACFTRAILESPPGALSREHRLDLLLAPCPYGSAASRAPVLHRVCDRNLLVVPDRDLLHKQHQAIYRHLGEIVASDHLAERDKVILCAAVHRKNFYTRVTAAQAAMKAGNAGAAAAMAAAILEGSRRRKSAAVLLKHLGVNLEDVLMALVHSSPQGRPWAPRIMAALPDAGMPESLIQKLLRELGPLTGMQRIGNRWSVTAAAPGARRVNGGAAHADPRADAHHSDNAYDTRVLPL